MRKTRMLKIPETIMIEKVLPFPFLDSVKHLASTCPQFANRDGARAADRIINAIMAAEKGAAPEFEIYEDDWKLLDAAFASPVAGYCPEIGAAGGKPIPVGAFNFVSYCDAVSPP